MAAAPEPDLAPVCGGSGSYQPPSAQSRSGLGGNGFTERGSTTLPGHCEKQDKPSYRYNRCFKRRGKMEGEEAVVRMRTAAAAWTKK